MASPGITTVVGGAVVAFDGREHRLIDPGVVAYAGDTIVYVGHRFTAESTQVIDAAGMLVIPGQISTHAHVSAHEGSRLLIDGGRRDFFRSGFLNYVPTRPGRPSFLNRQDARASLRFGMASLVRHGITTVVPFSPSGADGGQMMVDAAGEFGLRVYYSPLATGGRYHVDGEGRLEQVWDEAEGMRQLEVTEEYIAAHDGAHDGRFRGMVVIDELYFSTPLMRRRARALAEQLGTGLTLHCSEQLSEFHETVRRTGHTPVSLLDAEGCLGPRTVLAHCLYVATVRSPIPMAMTSRCLPRAERRLPIRRSRSPGAVERWKAFSAIWMRASTWRSAPTPIRSTCSRRCEPDRWWERLSRRTTSQRAP
jgi:5-methylthioadenosine/S-adenosylhomocysteine deaminase